MPKANKMVCPACGAEMNHHAEKPNYTAALLDPRAADPDFGAVLEETHTCPKCGTIAVRRA